MFVWRDWGTTKRRRGEGHQIYRHSKIGVESILRNWISVILSQSSFRVEREGVERVGMKDYVVSLCVSNRRVQKGESTGLDLLHLKGHLSPFLRIPPLRKDLEVLS